MTAQPPADDSTDADTTGEERSDSDTAADAPSDPQTERTEPSASNVDANPEPASDAESDDLAARLERLRPPQPPQAELDEPVPPAETLRAAAAQEGETASDDGGSEPIASDENADAHHDTAPPGAPVAARPDEREQRADLAALNDPQPVATELRAATEQAASDSSQGQSLAAEDTSKTDAATAADQREPDRDDTEGSEEV